MASVLHLPFNCHLIPQGQRHNEAFIYDVVDPASNNCSFTRFVHLCVELSCRKSLVTGLQLSTTSQICCLFLI